MNLQKNKIKIAFILIALLLIAPGCKKSPQEEAVEKEFAVNAMLIQEDGQAADTLFIPGERVKIRTFIDNFEAEGPSFELNANFFIMDENNKVIPKISKYDYRLKGDKLPSEEKSYHADYEFDTFNLDEGSYSIKIAVKDEVGKKVFIEQVNFKLEFPEELTILEPVLLDEKGEVNPTSYYNFGDEVAFYLRAAGIKNSFADGKFKTNLTGDIVIIDGEGEKIDQLTNAIEYNSYLDEPIDYFAGNFRIDTSGYGKGEYVILVRVKDVEADKTEYAKKKFELI